MSTHPEFVQYLLDQLEGLGELRARKMFGDYLVYLNDRPALLVCDGTPFAKPLPCVAELLKDRPTAPPYEGAKATTSWTRRTGTPCAGRRSWCPRTARRPKNGGGRHDEAHRPEKISVPPRGRK